jgi:phosphoenolpyruvate synthase/pyruvate phosphate dikinase
LEFFNKFIKTSEEWWYYGVMMEDKGEIIVRKMIPEFAVRHKLDIGKASEIFNVLSHPREKSIFNAERKDFLDICLVILEDKRLLKFLVQNNHAGLLKNSKLKPKINHYIHEYFWIKTDYSHAEIITPELILNSIKKEIKNVSKNKIKEEFSLLNGLQVKFENQKLKILEKIKLNLSDRKDIYFVQKIIYWNDVRKMGMMILFHYLFRFMEDIGVKYGLSFSEISLYQPEEIINILAKNKKISQSEIKKRIDGIFTVFENGKPIQMFYGEAERMLFKIATEVKSDKIKGQVASNAGKKIVKGIARLVFNPNKDEFNAGEILVASMTRIEFVPLMRRAKAIITNEGGLACHAAIISRELGIPCIIGTKIATKVLKDGDMVEVDADKGIVRIIK